MSSKTQSCGKLHIIDVLCEFDLMWGVRVGEWIGRGWGEGRLKGVWLIPGLGSVFTGAILCMGALLGISHGCLGSYLGKMVV